MELRKTVEIALIAWIALSAATTIPWVVATTAATGRAPTTTDQVVHPGNSNTPVPHYSIGISPEYSSVVSGQSKTYTAAILDPPAGIFDIEYTWSLSVAAMGSLAPSGQSVTFTPNPVSQPTSVTLSVTMLAFDPNVFGGIVSGSGAVDVEVIPSLLVGSVLPDPDPATPGSEVSLSVPVTYGEPPYTLVFNCGDGTQITALLSVAGTSTVNHLYTAGTYTPSVLVTDAAGESVTTSSSSTLVVTEGLAVTLSAPRSTDVGTPVTVMASVVGGEEPYTYLWKATDGAGSSQSGSWSFTPDSTGTIGVSVTVTDALGASAPSGTFLISVNPGPSVLLTSSAASADVGTSFPISATIAGGNPPYRLTWTDPSENAAFSTTEVSAGTFSLPYAFESPGNVVLDATVTDGNGVVTSSDTTLGTVRALPTVSLSTSPSTPSVGSTVVVYGTIEGGTPPYSYLFDSVGPVTGSAPASGTLTQGGVVEWSGVLTGAGPVDIGLDVTDGSGGQAATSASIDGILPLTTGFLSGSGRGEVGQSLLVDLSAFGGTPPYSYVITGSDGETVSGMLPQAGGFAVDLLPRAAGNVSYAAVVTDSTGASSTTHGTVYVVPALSAILNWGPQAVDAGEALQATVSAAGGCAPYSATLTTSAGAVAVFNDFTTPENTSLRFATSGGYDLTVSLTDSCGVSSSRSDSLEVAPDPLVNLSVSSTHTEVGVPVTFAIGVQGGIGPFQGTVSFGDGITDNTLISQHTYNQAGTYTVNATVRDGTGSIAASSPVFVSVIPDPRTMATVAFPGADVGHALSFGSSVAYGTPPYTYDWNFGDGLASTLSDPAHVYSATGLYEVTLSVTDSLGQMSSSQPINVTVVDPPVLSLNANRTAVDVGQPLFLSATEIGGAGVPSIVWEFGDGTAVTGPSVQHSYARPGTYDVSVSLTDAAGVTVATSLTVTVGSALSPTTVTIPTSALEDGAVSTLHVLPVGGVAPYRLVWKAGTAGAIGMDLDNFSVVPAAPGVLTGAVNISDASGAMVGIPFAFAVSAPLSLNVSLLPYAPEVGIPFTIQGAVHGGVGPYRYSYSLPSGQVSGTNLSYVTTVPDRAGVIEVAVSVEDALGVTATATRQVVVAPPLAVTLGGTALFADEGANVSVPYVISGGVGPVLTILTTPEGLYRNHTEPVFYTPGTYPVEIATSDADGGYSIGWVNVTVVPPLLLALLHAPRSVAVGVPTNFSATASGGEGPYSVSWSVTGLGTTGGNPVTLMFPNAGTYSMAVAASDASGGSTTLWLNVTAYNDSLSLRANATPAVGIVPLAPRVEIEFLGGHGPIDFAVALDETPVANVTAWAPGTPWGTETLVNTPGSHQLYIRAIDALGDRTATTLNLTSCQAIGPPTVIPTEPSMTAGEVGRLSVASTEPPCPGATVVFHWWGLGIVSSQGANATFIRNATGIVVDRVSEVLSGENGAVLQNLTTSFPVVVLPGTPVQLQGQTPASQAVAGTNLSLTVWACDANGNRNQSYNGTLVLGSSANTTEMSVSFSHGEATVVLRSLRAGTVSYTGSSGELAPWEFNVTWMPDSDQIVLRVIAYAAVHSDLYLNVSVTDPYGNEITGVMVDASAPGLPVARGNASDGTVLLVIVGGSGAQVVTLTGPGGARTVLTIGSDPSGTTTGTLVAYFGGLGVVGGLIALFVFRRKRSRRGNKGAEADLAKLEEAQRALESSLRKWPGEDRESLLLMAADQKIERKIAEEALAALETKGVAGKEVDGEGVERWKLSSTQVGVSP